MPPPVLASLREAEPGIQSELVASNQITNLLRREADIAVRMVRPAQASLVAREQFVLRTDDQRAYVALVAAGDGIGFVARYTLRLFSGVLFVLPQLKIAPLPCWLAVHREIRGNRVVRRVYDFLAAALPAALNPR